MRKDEKIFSSFLLFLPNFSSSSFVFSHSNALCISSTSSKKKIFVYFKIDLKIPSEFFFVRIFRLSRSRTIFLLKFVEYPPLCYRVMQLSCLCMTWELASGVKNQKQPWLKQSLVCLLNI